MSEAAVLADLERALTATQAVVGGIQPNQWTLPTPCTELDVREVLNHLVSGNLLFAAIVRGEPLPDRDADQLGVDPPAAGFSAGPPDTGPPPPDQPGRRMKRFTPDGARIDQRPPGP
jgi:uncharacterized protein (TIGR03083 family)